MPILQCWPTRLSMRTRKAKYSWSNGPEKILGIATGQTMPINMIRWKQRDNDSAEAGTSWILWLHHTTAPRTPTEPISVGRARSLIASLAESHGHWDICQQKSQSLPGPYQLGSPVHQEQKIHPSISRTQQFRTKHARVTSDTTYTTNGEVSVATQRATSECGYTQDCFAMTLVMSSTALKTNSREAPTRQIY